MTRRDLQIGRWYVEFYFADRDGYDIDELLEQYGTDDKPSPKMAKLVKSKSESNLFRHGRVVYDDYTFFDITACHSQTYRGKRFYRISAEENSS